MFPISFSSLRGVFAGAVLAGALALAQGAAAQMTPVSMGPPIQLRALIDQGTPMQAAPQAAVIRLAAPASGWPRYGQGLDPQTCLTQAVYYEARSQSREGQEAVAQVVINRTRSPQFPSAVCDVVYEGADVGVGCQFTFVCDGSLDTPGYGAAWDEAEDVAKKALAGYVDTPMLGATHYHAVYVSPAWSHQLTRIRRIGAHIFYR